MLSVVTSGVFAVSEALRRPTTGNCCAFFVQNKVLKNNLQNISNHSAFRTKHIKYASFDQPNVFGVLLTLKSFPAEKCKNITEQQQHHHNRTWKNRGIQLPAALRPLVAAGGNILLANTSLNRLNVYMTPFGKGLCMIVGFDRLL